MVETTMWLNKRRGVRPMLALATLPAGAGAVVSPTPVCVGESPTAVTRWVWQRPSLDTPDANRFLAAALLESIRRDAARAKRADEPCAICNGELWTNSPEGEAREPVTSAMTSRPGDRAEVVYAFRFSVDPSESTAQRRTRITLLKEAGCWKIDDLRYGAADSMKRWLNENR